MKKIIWILFLLGSAVVCIAQPGYPVNLRNVIIGYQTTPEGLFFRGNHSPTHIPLEKYGTFMYVDTLTRQIWMYLNKDIVNGQPVGVWAKMYPSVSDLSSLTDVNTIGKIQNSMLIYDTETSKWIIDNGTVYRKTTDALSGEVYGAYNDTKLDSVSALYFDLDTPPVTLGVGMLSWDTTTGTASLGLLGGNVQLKVGQQLVKRVVNKTTTNVNLLRSEYKVVKLSGASGSRISVDLAQANNEAGSAGTLGVVIEDINKNQEGFILVAGEITNINTTGDLVNEDWNEGDVLYLSATTPGALTKVKPTPPNHTVIVGWVESVNANNGKIYVKIDNGYELEELHNVLTTGKTNGSILYYDNGLWKASTGITLDNTGTLALNAVTANTLMYVDADNKLRSVTLTTENSSGAATFSNGTLNIPQYAGSTNLTFDGANSPVTLNSSTGTGVTFTAGTNISLSQANNNLTINSTAISSNIYNSNGSIPASTTREVTVPDNSAVKFLETTTKFTNIKGGSVLLQSSANNTLEANTSGLFRSSSTPNGNSSVQLSAGQVGLYGQVGENQVVPGLFVTADNKTGFTASSTGTSDSVVVKTAITNELKSLTPQETRTFILPSQANNANKYLKTNGTDVSWETVTGGGTITGTGAANRVAFWDGTNTISSNERFKWDNSLGRLGIGYGEYTTLPSARLSVIDTITGATGGVFSSNATLLPSVPGVNHNSASITTNIPASNTQTLGFIFGSINLVNNSGTGNIGDVRGLALNFNNDAPSGTVSFGRGGFFNVRNRGGATISNAYTGNFNIENTSTGTISNAYGVLVDVLNSGTGTIGNTYGFYCDDITEGIQTNTPFSFYASDPNAYNYFAGRVGIGTISPQNLLHVAGSFRVDDAAAAATPGFNATRIAVVDNNGRMRSVAVGSGLDLNPTTNTLSATGGAAGTVTVSGTPSAGQIALWTGASSIQGVNTLEVSKGGTGATDAATARTNLGGTTVGQSMFTLTNPSAITFPRFNADNTVSALNAADFRTAIGAGTVTGAGTNTHVTFWNGTSSLSSSANMTWNNTTGRLTLANDLTVAGAVRVGLGNNSIATNLALGNSALNSITTGTANLAFGVGSSATLNTGYNNTSIGGYALNKATTAYENLAIGGYSMFELTTGVANVGIGNGTLGKITNQTNNTAIGAGALAGINTSGNVNNTAIGMSAGRFIAGNTIEATDVLAGIFIGTYSGPLNATGSNREIVIGHSRKGNGPYTTTIGSDGVQKTFIPSGSLFLSGTPPPISDNNYDLIVRNNTSGLSLGEISTVSVLSASKGGTGLNSYTVGDLIQATGATTLSKLASTATGNVLLSGGVATASSWGKVGLATHVAGTLPVANGGTNTATTPTPGQTLIATNTTTYTPITPSTYTGSSTATPITWDVNYRSSGVYRISNTSTATITGVTVSNVVAGGIYAFHISGASNTVTITVQWPNTFKDLALSNYGTRVYTTPTIITCYHDGAQFVCE